MQNDEPPEITYCVVDQAGTLSLQALTPTQPMPAEDELNAKFAELVVSAAVLGWGTSRLLRCVDCALHGADRAFLEKLVDRPSVVGQTTRLLWNRDDFRVLISCHFFLS